MAGLPVFTDAVTTMPDWETRLLWLSVTTNTGCAARGTLLLSDVDGCVVIARKAGGPATSASAELATAEERPGEVNRSEYCR